MSLPTSGRRLFSWPKAELIGFLSSGRQRSVQKLGLALEPGGEESKRKGAPEFLDKGALGQLLKQLSALDHMFSKAALPALQGPLCLEKGPTGFS